VAARLAGRGTRLQQMIATLVEFAARGVVRIEERQGAPRLFGRSFDVRLVAEPTTPEPHEAALLDLLFGHAGHRSRSITWRRVQQQANSKSLAFGRALLETMRRAGFVDEDRVVSRRTLGRAAGVVAILACGTIVLAVVLLPLFGGWAFVVPLAVSAVAIAFAVSAASLSVLSRRGEEEAHQWKGFLAALERSARAKDTPRSIPADWLPWAVAAGVGHLAAKRLTGPVPPWFQAAASGEDGNIAFAALLHTSGTAAGYDGGAAGGGAAGAAGGGSSGAS